jgi:hypothetical protein
VVRTARTPSTLSTNAAATQQQQQQQQQQHPRSIQSASAKRASASIPAPHPALVCPNNGKRGPGAMPSTFPRSPPCRSTWRECRPRLRCTCSRPLATPASCARPRKAKGGDGAVVSGCGAPEAAELGRGRRHACARGGEVKRDKGRGQPGGGARPSGVAAHRLVDTAVPAMAMALGL